MGPRWNVHRPKKPAGDVRPQQSRSEQFSIGRNQPAATEAQLKEIFLNATGRVRSSIGSAGTAMLFAVAGAVLLGAAVLVAFLLRPPLLGWVGFAVVCAIGIGLATGDSRRRDQRLIRGEVMVTHRNIAERRGTDLVETLARR